MNFALDNDHILLRNSAAAFVDNETRLEPLLVPGAGVESVDYLQNWDRIRELGWQGLIVPETFGGAGLDCIELSLIVTELGRTLMPAPFAGHTFGTWAVLAAASDEQTSEWLPEAAADSSTLCLVPPIDGNRITASNDALSGVHELVLDAAVADRLIVAAQTSGRWQFYAAERNASGVEVTVQPWRDVTRQVCRVEFSGAAAEPLPGDFDATWPWVHDRISLFLSAENVGGMRHVLDKAVEYARERVAFGRPIGANQAIKHPLADMLGRLESSSTAVLFGAWALATSDSAGSLAASMAKAYSSGAYMSATHRSIQTFGAIGFTWEMPNHLYYKRARGNAALFGDIRRHRDQVVNLATGKAWSRPFDLSRTSELA